MTFIEEITKPIINPSKLQGSIFEQLKYINTLPYNIVVIASVILFGFLLWFFYGLGTGKSRYMRLNISKHPNYYFFLVILLIQTLLIIGFYFFPILFWIFE